MAGLQQRANAFGDPGRHHSVGCAAVGSGPGGGVGLTAPLATHHGKAVRKRVAKVVAAELTVEATRRSAGPGRPLLPDGPDPAARRKWGITGQHERLSMWLSATVRADDEPVVVERQAVDHRARHDFDASVVRQGDAAEITPRPHRLVTTTVADPATVCACHIVDRTRALRRAGRVGGRRKRVYPSRRACFRLRCNVESADLAGTAP